MNALKSKVFLIIMFSEKIICKLVKYNIIIVIYLNIYYQCFKIFILRRHISYSKIRYHIK